MIYIKLLYDDLKVSLLKILRFAQNDEGEYAQTHYPTSLLNGPAFAGGQFFYLLADACDAGEFF